MKTSAVLAVALCGSANAYAPQVKPNVQPTKPAFDLKKAAVATLTAATIATSTLAPMADAIDFAPSNFGSSQIIAETRQGVYKEYDVDVTEQTVDDAKSSFKSAKETKSKKGKYTALLSILVVGSFIIPMAQYFWYVRDDDSSDNFFAQKVPEPEPEPVKKKGWFGK